MVTEGVVHHPDEFDEPAGGDGVTSHGALTGRNNSGQHTGDAIDIGTGTFEGTLTEWGNFIEGQLGGGGGANEVYFANMMLTEAQAVDAGYTVTPGVSVDFSPGITPGRYVILYDDGSYESFIAIADDPIASLEVPQLSTLSVQEPYAGQSALLNVGTDYTSGAETVNTLYLMYENGLTPLASAAGGGDPIMLPPSSITVSAEMLPALGATYTSGVGIEFGGSPGIPADSRITVYEQNDQNVYNYTFDGVTTATFADVQYSDLLADVGPISVGVFQTGLDYLTGDDDVSGPGAIYAIVAVDGHGASLVPLGGQRRVERSVHDHNDSVDFPKSYDRGSVIVLGDGASLELRGYDEQGQQWSVGTEFVVYNGDEFATTIDAYYGEGGITGIYRNGVLTSSVPLRPKSTVTVRLHSGGYWTVDGDGWSEAVGFAVNDPADDIDLGAAAPEGLPPFPWVIYGRVDNTEDGVYDIQGGEWVKRFAQPDMFVAVQTVDAAFDPITTRFVTVFTPDPTEGGWGPLSYMPTTPAIQTVGTESVTADTTLGGPPRTVVTAIEVDGTVELPTATAEDVGQHWHIATGPYELTVVGCDGGDVTVPAGMVLSVVGFEGPGPVYGWATLGFKSQDPPASATDFAPATRTVGTGLGTTGTVDLDMAAVHGTIQTITASGSITFTTSNRAAGREVTLVIAAGGSSRTLAWPSWLAVGAAPPTTLASGKTLAVTVTFTDTTDAAAIAAAAAQP